jgi:hypothetical protein
MMATAWKWEQKRKIEEDLSRQIPDLN